MSNIMQYEQLKTFLDKYSLPERRTLFQLKNFVLGQECTIQGQMWQIIRELTVLSENINAIDLQIEESRDDAELIDLNISKLTSKRAKSDFNRKKLEIHLRKLNRRRKSLENDINKMLRKKENILEEVSFFLQAFESLNKNHDYKPLDDFESQGEYWDEKYREELTFSLLLKNRLSSEFVRNVLALENNSSTKTQLVGILQNMQVMMQQEQKAFLEAQPKK